VSREEGPPRHGPGGGLVRSGRIGSEATCTSGSMMMFKTMGSGGSKMQQRLMSQMGGGSDLDGSP